MENNQSNKYVFISVTDSPEHSFYYDLIHQCLAKDKNLHTSDAQSSIEVSKETYDRLSSGESTFEKEVHFGSIQIDGDYRAIIDFGKSLS